LLLNANSKNLHEDYVNYGNTILTTTVLSICVSAPTAAIFINSFGKKLLNYDGDDDKDKIEL